MSQGALDPEEQRELQKEVYRPRGILKHLEERGMFESQGILPTLRRPITGARGASRRGAA